MNYHLARNIAAWLFLAFALLGIPAQAATPMVAAGAAHTCALLNSGVVQCWGNNTYGLLGNGTTTDSVIPVIVSGINNATAVSAGNSHSCALLSTRAVLCWGENNSYGQLGNGSTADSTVPVTVSGISNATALSAGYGHTCARLSSGTVQCWGYNEYGSLGNGSTTDSTIPVTVSGISNATMVSAGAGANHTCVVLSSGAVQCWGLNARGELGNGNTTNSTIPVTVSGISNATAVAGGYNHTCAVLSNGTVQCWGSNEYGQLGNGSTANSATPVTVSGISNATIVSAAADNTCAILSSGVVQCWGNNYFGQLGNGSTADSAIPVTVSSINNALSVSVGDGHTCAVLNNGAVLCWGYNDYNRIFNIDSTKSTIPITVNGLFLGASSLNITEADKVLDWAEIAYPQLFAPAGQMSQSTAGYRFRAYPVTHSYLGTNEFGTAKLYYFGPASNSQLLDLGLLSGWLDQPKQLTLTGVFRDSIVQGLRYVATGPTGAVREGVTNDQGEYSYFDKGKIEFYLGNILLASINNPTATTVTAFLAQEPAATNIARLLQTLDDDGDPSNGIVIPAAVQTNALSVTSAKLDFSSVNFDSQFALLKPALLSGSSIPNSRALVSTVDASTHAGKSARLAYLIDTHLGKALEGKLTYPVSYNLDALKKSEYQRVRQYVWEYRIRPKLDYYITLGNGHVDGIDGGHAIVKSTLDLANSGLEAVNSFLDFKELSDRGISGLSTARKVYFSISKFDDGVGSACSVVGYLASDDPTIDSQSNPVQYISTYLKDKSKPLTIDQTWCEIYKKAHLGLLPDGDFRFEKANNTIIDLVSKAETELLKSANHGWKIANSLSNGVKLSPIDELKYAVQIANIVNDVQAATLLSLNTEEVTSLLIARIYMDSWVRSAGDRNFMAKLIGGQTGADSLTKNRDEDIDALVRYYATTGVWCDTKTFMAGVWQRDINEGIDNILAGKVPQGVNCQPNVDKNLINSTINKMVDQMNSELQSLQTQIGPFAVSNTFDIPLACSATQVLQNGACVASTSLKSCAAETLNWTASGQTCSAASGTAASGQTVLIADTLGTATGSANFTCTNGVWGAGQSASCTATPATLKSCAASVLSWTAGGQTCSSSSSAATSGQTVQVSDTVGTTGTASFMCTDGAWGVAQSASCNAASVTPVALKPCATAVLSWTAGGQTCSGSSSAATSGQTVQVSDTVGTTGTANFTCADGAWGAAQSASCAAAPVTGATVLKVSAGGGHTCSVLSNGKVQCWGYNNQGQLGNGSKTNSATPVTVSGISNAIGVATGDYHTCAVLSSGAVQCWGYNQFGQLGNSGTFATPVTVSGIDNATAVTAGRYHTCVLLGSGAIQCWGYNQFGQLGNVSIITGATPVTVGGISNATAVTAGGYHSCAVLGNGTVQCWGDNEYGQLGNGSTTTSMTPVTVSGISNALAISAGEYQTCAVLSGGVVQCWGQIDTATVTVAIGSLSPVTVSGISNATAVAAGSTHVCAALSSGAVQCWGNNYNGELGNGSTTNSTIPVTVSNISNVTAVTAGWEHTCAMLGSGAVQCWGYNARGSLGNGSTTSSTTPVTVK